MSIFINSKVHLPISCEKCPFNYADLSVGICMAADKTIDTRTYGRKRHPDCPMTEIPTPHGRLIDADKLVWFIDNHIASGKKWVEFETIKDMINSLPTIIEAEVE